MTCKFVQCVQGSNIYYCHRPVLDGSGFCHWHDPQRQHTNLSHHPAYFEQDTTTPCFEKPSNPIHRVAEIFDECFTISLVVTKLGAMPSDRKAAFIGRLRKIIQELS